MDKTKKAGILKTVKFVAILVLLCGIVFFCLYYKVFSVDNIIKHTPDNWFLAAVFLLFMYALGNLSFLFPIAVFYVAGGTIFPLPLALFINFLGSLICIVLPYIFGWYKGAESVSKALSKKPKLQKIFELEKDNEWFVSYILRVINLLPMDLVSIFLGAKHVNPTKYITGSMLGNLPGLISITIVGSSITNPLSPTFIISLSITIFISVLSVVIYYFYKKRKLV